MSSGLHCIWVAGCGARFLGGIWACLIPAQTASVNAMRAHMEKKADSPFQNHGAYYAGGWAGIAVVSGWSALPATFPDKMMETDCLRGTAAPE